MKKEILEEWMTLVSDHAKAHRAGFMGSAKEASDSRRATQILRSKIEKKLSRLLSDLEAAQKDAARLMFACEFDGYVGIEKDKYDYACDCMDEAGRDEPNEEDELNGLRRLIDAKMASKS